MIIPIYVHKEEEKKEEVANTCF